MRAAVILVISLAGCGRIGFDPVADGASGAQAPSNLRYDRVLPVYITGYAMPMLTPAVDGVVASYSIAPALPAGMQLDPVRGTIDGTPSVARAAAQYTVTARNAAGQTQAAIRIRTADGYIVTSGGDADDAVPGDAMCQTPAVTAECTLRAAVSEIDAAGGTKDVIYIPAQTITLPASLPGAAQSIEIVGESTTSTIVDGSGMAIISFAANNVTLTLSYLTFRNALEIDHTFRTGISLVVDRVLVTGCTGFASTASDGTVTLTNSTFDSNFDNLVTTSSGPITIDSCTFVGNNIGTNGLLYFVFGTGTLTNSTFTNNAGQGSPVAIDNATFSFAHDTFAANTATAASRGGAVTQFSGATTTWTNNLLSSNNGPAGNCSIAGGHTSNGGNLAFPASPSCPFDASTDVMAAPRLAALADNGGPTLTMALGAGSPAIDAAMTAGCLPTDQRGVARPLGAACDIGAVEQQ